MQMFAGRMQHMSGIGIRTGRNGMLVNLVHHCSSCHVLFVPYYGHTEIGKYVYGHCLGVVVRRSCRFILIYISRDCGKCLKKSYTSGIATPSRGTLVDAHRGCAYMFICMNERVHACMSICLSMCACMSICLSMCPCISFYIRIVDISCNK